MPTSPILIACLAGLLAACATQAKQAHDSAQPVAGWYMRHAGSETLQPCGQDRPLRIVGAADLPERARAFGLADDSPVYVKVMVRDLPAKADTHAGAAQAVQVERVVQFGSPAPVRDCPLTGVVLPAAPDGARQGH